MSNTAATTTLVDWKDFDINKFEIDSAWAEGAKVPLLNTHYNGMDHVYLVGPLLRAPFGVSESKFKPGDFSFNLNLDGEEGAAWSALVNAIEKRTLTHLSKHSAELLGMDGHVDEVSLKRYSWNSSITTDQARQKNATINAEKAKANGGGNGSGNGGEQRSYPDTHRGKITNEGKQMTRFFNATDNSPMSLEEMPRWVQGGKNASGCFKVLWKLPYPYYVSKKCGVTWTAAQIQYLPGSSFSRQVPQDSLLPAVSAADVPASLASADDDAIEEWDASSDPCFAKPPDFAATATTSAVNDAEERFIEEAATAIEQAITKPASVPPKKRGTTPTPKNLGSSNPLKKRAIAPAPATTKKQTA